MTWLNRFLNKKLDSLAPLAPIQETQYLCGSKRDKTLVPNLSQSCPSEKGTLSFLACSPPPGQNVEALGQLIERDLSNPKHMSSLALNSIGTNGTSGTSLFEPQRKTIFPFAKDAFDLWEERAAILEFEAGFSRAQAEARATAELFLAGKKGAA